MDIKNRYPSIIY